jgi:hypothetical protein
VPYGHLPRRELPAERRLVEVVDERARTVDLDDRQPLPVGLLETIVAGDVDLLVVESELVLQPLELCTRPVTERAARRVEDDDSGDVSPRDTGRA